MIRKLLLLSLLIISFSAITQAQNSYIQVVAEPGISVFLDGQLKGITNADVGGLIIDKLSAGTYTIKVVKEGFTPQEESISVKAGEVLMYQVKPFTPQIRIRQQGNENQQTIVLKTGNLKIQSVPVEIIIKIEKLNINSNKKQDEWYAEELPAGDYSVEFFWDKKSVKELVMISENMQTEIFVNMITGKVEFKDDISITNRGVETRSVDSNGYGYGSGTGTRGISFDLAGRTPTKLPNPTYDIQSEGIVVVEITVDRNGNVTKAVAGVKGSTTLEEYFLRVATEAALAAKFDAKPDAPIFQKGSITYHFILR